MTHTATVETALWLTAVITIGYQLLFFFIAAYFKFDKVTDLAGGSNFVIIAIVIFLLYGLPFPYSRQIIVTVLVCTWGIRLSLFLLYRVIVIDKDDRFDNIRDNFFKFLVFWIFQMLWVWIVSLPVTYLNSVENNVRSDLNYVDIIGIVLAGIGLITEAIADQTKFYFK